MNRSLSRSFRRPVTIVTTAALALTGSLMTTATAYANTPAPPDFTGFNDGQYIVVLNGDGAATYQGGLPNLTATAPVGTQSLDDSEPAVVEYTDHIVSEQLDVASDAGVTVISNLSLTMNGFTASLTEAQAVELSTDPRVSGVYESQMYQITGSPSNEFLDVEGMFDQVGGSAEAGAGVVVGIIDTGIAPENPLFAGDALGTEAGAEPYLDGDVITFVKGDGGTFTGTCQEGVQFTADMCSTKIVGARYYVEGFTEARLGTPETGEYVSPRDGDSHGSHTASTAAGNYEVPITSQGGADLGTMSGVAPSARISSYKACWNGPDNSTQEDDGCNGIDLLAAVEQATADGVDVINYSIGGGSDDTNVDPVDIAFLGAASAGIFVSASAGNSGPGASTLDHGEPWLTTVANTTIPNYEGTVTLEAGATFPGASVTLPVDGSPVTGTLIYAGDAVAAGATAANARLCMPGSLDASLVDGKIVVCDRGTNARVEKSDVVAAAGGIGMVLLNVAAGESIDIDDHAVPSVHLIVDYRDAIMAAARAGESVTFTAGNTSGIETNAPVVAGGSSRGPVATGGMDIIKPDIAAPGTGIIAAGANAAGADPAFVFMSGTSMSSPHVAGLAAVYLGENPQATPDEIKSALMTTATNVLNEDGTESTDWLAQGAGFVNTASFLDAGLYYANDQNDWYGYLRGQGYNLPEEWVGSAIDASNLNLASIGIGALTGPETLTRTVTALEPGSYTVSVAAPAGIDVQVSPSTLEFSAAGESQSFEIAISPTDAAAADQWAFGSLTWSSAEHSVRSPIAVLPRAVSAPEWVEGTDTSGQVPVSIVSGRNDAIELTAHGLAAMENITTGNGTAPQQSNQLVTVSDGTLGLYISLTTPEQAADLDLDLFLVDDSFNIVQRWQSATAAANESIHIDNPQAGNYVARATVFSTPDGVPVDWSLDQAQVQPGAGVGRFSTDPQSIDGVINGQHAFDASWQGLELDQEYVGIVTYSTTEETRTWVHVTTGAVGLPEATRLEGATRYETAVAVSQHGWSDGAETVYIASGEVFADGLSAGPAAAHDDAPLLLTTQARLPAATLAELERLAPATIVIAGGEQAVSAAVEADLAATGAEVIRVAGADRYETSRMIAARSFDTAGTVLIATGRNFPDALSAGAAAGSIDVPVILVDGMRTEIDSATTDALTDLGTTATRVIGGEASISQGLYTGLYNGVFYPQRISGSTRFETSVEISQAFFNAPVPAMYIANGMNFPDALSASALAGMQGAPLYVSPGACVPSDLIGDSLRLGQPDVYLMGGEASLAATVASYQTCG